jgi:threonine dehydrogenase-like Zn-dependent dehydrogenase
LRGAEFIGTACRVATPENPQCQRRFHPVAANQERTAHGVASLLRSRFRHRGRGYENFREEPRCIDGGDSQGGDPMRALTWHGQGDIRCESVPDPKIQHPRDAIIKVTGCAICGSDLHIYDGLIPSMERGDVLGHETMGEVVEVGSGNTRLKKGDRVVVPFTIACGECFFCQRGCFSACERSNPNATEASKLWGHSPAGLFGYSHLLGGFPGGQAEYLRVPFADVGPIRIPEGLTDEQALFLSDIFPTGYMGAEFCDIKGGETIAVFGCGPVAQFSIRSAFLLGAERVIAIDTIPERLKMAADAGAITIDFMKDDVYERIQELTGGRGADACIDAVGSEPHTAASFDSMLDRAKVALFLSTDRPHVLRQAIHNTRNFGVVSIIGVYGGFVDKIPMGSAINRGLTFRMAQTPVQHYLPKLLKLIEDGRIDPSFVITHKVGLEKGPEMYKTFRDKQDGCIKVMITP